MGAVQIEIGEDNGEIALEQCFSEIFNLQAFNIIQKSNCKQIV